MLYIGNAFSLNMLNVNGVTTLKVKELSNDEAISLLSNNEFNSVIGHASTAEYVTLLTGIQVSANRVSVTLKPEDKLLVIQLLGRLPEGVILTTEEVAKVPSKWYLVTVSDS